MNNRLQHAAYAAVVKSSWGYTFIGFGRDAALRERASA